MGGDISRLFFFKTGIHAILYDRMLPRFIHKAFMKILQPARLLTSAE
jgi:hypothetical protein